MALAAFGFAGCGEVTPIATPRLTDTPAPTATVLPTWTPTPVPTPTPITPAEIRILWPDQVSPLAPVPIEAEFVPPPGVAATARIDATVMDPKAQVYASFSLSERDGNVYRSPDLLQFPLEPLSGYWWLIVHVDSGLPVTGDPALYFEVDPVVFRDLTGTLPSGVTMHVPVGFEEVVAQGNSWAGGRIWAHADGEVALWWAPGPTEALAVSNALAALEATYAADPRGIDAPAVSEVLPIDWQGRPGFAFPETWPGSAGGPGRAWVIQGQDYWLYVLRVRGLGTDDMPSLHEAVARTFALETSTR